LLSVHPLVERTSGVGALVHLNRSFASAARRSDESESGGTRASQDESSASEGLSSGKDCTKAGDLTSGAVVVPDLGKAIGGGIAKEAEQSQDGFGAHVCCGDIINLVGHSIYLIRSAGSCRNRYLSSAVSIDTQKQSSTYNQQKRRLHFCSEEKK